MRNMRKMALAVLAVCVLVAGMTGAALASQNGPNIPNYNSPPDTTQPGWFHSIPGGGYTGYPPDYSNTPNSNGWDPMGSPDTQAQTVVPVAPYLGNDQRSHHNS